MCRNVANQLTEEKKSICVFDESGCDFSILVTSLVQILLDPYYRTLVGFQALVQKDWVMGGHPFSNRLKNIHEEQVHTQVRYYLEMLSKKLNNSFLLFYEEFYTKIGGSVNLLKIIYQAYLMLH